MLLIVGIEDVEGIAIRNLDDLAGQIAQTNVKAQQIAETDNADRLWQNVWWSLTTVTTGGFADLYPPKTIVGRLLTVLLVLVGAGLIAVFTATVTTIILGEEAQELKANQDEIRDTLTGLQKSHKKIEETLK